jgi:hypothetical protein
MDDKAKLQQLEAKIKERVPSFEIRYKDESWFMKILGYAMWLFNRQFMTRFTTTIGTKVYFPSRAAVEANPRSYWKTLAHEYVHILDSEKQKFWFTVSYLLPQLMGVVALLAFGAFVWPKLLWALVALVFFAPWPSPWRSKWELRGYTMSLAVNYWRYGHVSESTKAWIGSHFWGWNYYKMAWGKARVRKNIDQAVDRIVTGGVFADSPAYQDVLDVLNSAEDQVA